jgi:predicted permease
MQTLLQDFRYGFRQLLRSPGFSITAILSLALGIGATTAVFSVIYAVLMDPFPYPTADRIVRLELKTAAGEKRGIGLNGPQIEELRKSPVLDGLLVIDGWSLTITGAELPEEVDGSYLSADSFDQLGVPMLLGRGFTPAEGAFGQEPSAVVVISYKFWQRHYNGSKEVLGKTIELSHKKYTILGVAPPRFTWYSGEVYLPLKLTSDPGPVYIVNLLLKPGVSRAQANAALEPMLEQFQHQTPKRFPQHFRVVVEGLNDWVVTSLGGTLYLLFGAVALLLAIGCGNVSILLLARGAARQTELAIRAAVGAGRARIVRQLLTESLLLAVTGAALGIGLAFGMLKVILIELPRYSFAPEVAIRINLPVLAFSVAVGLFTGVFFGLWPALQLSRPNIGQVMQSGVRKIAGGARSRRTHGALVAIQIALTLMLLAAAGGAMQSFVRLMHTPLGYDPANVLPVWTPLPDGKFPTWAERAAYFEQVRARLGQLPGVTMSAVSTNATPPYSGSNWNYEIVGQPATEQVTLKANLVSPQYFAALRIPLLKGRIWTEAENRAGVRVAVINQTMARLKFPAGDAIGRSIRFPQIENRPPIVLTPPASGDSSFEVIGIVEDTLNDGLRNPIKPAVYIPFTQMLSPYSQYLLRTSVAPETLVHAVRVELTRINPDQETGAELEELAKYIPEQPEWAQEHLVAWIFASFSVLAQILAAIGLYSVVSYSVAQRTNEFGIRIALGAQKRHVLGIVFRSTAWSVGAGILAGVGLTVALNRVLASWAAGASANPLILMAATLLLALVAALACALPARRAASVDPMSALRCD